MSDEFAKAAEWDNHQWSSPLGTFPRPKSAIRQHAKVGYRRDHAMRMIISDGKTTPFRRFPRQTLSQWKVFSDLNFPFGATADLLTWGRVGQGGGFSFISIISGL